MRRRLASLAIAALLAACGSEETSQVAPLPASSSTRRAPVAEPPAPAIVSPHLRRTDPSRTAHDVIGSLGSGGGGGGSRSQAEPPPTQRQVDAFRQRFDPALAENVDPTEDPCDQFGDVMRTTVEATDPHADPSLPSRAELRRSCQRLPEAYRQCLSPEYFQAHIDECNAEMERMAERGERRSARAQRQWDALQSGRARPRDDDPAEDG